MDSDTRTATPLRVGRQRYGEFVALISAFGALVAAGIDVMLPAFDEMRVAYGLAPDATDLTFALTTYFVGMGVGQLAWGPISDRFGRKRTLSAGLALYVLGAVGSMWGPSLEALYVSRLIWGVGAAACLTTSLAVTRDVFSGNAMARVLVLAQTIFMLGPVISPVIGHLIVEATGWRWVFGFCALLAATLLMWARRLDETLPESSRMPLNFARTARAFRAVVSTRATLLYGLCRTFLFGGFLIYLGSSEILISEVYGRGSSFAWYFGAMGIVMGISSYGMTRLVNSRGARSVLYGSLTAFVTASVALLVVSLVGNGKPNFWLWLGMLAAANAGSIAINPTSNSLAMEPMGEIAGTASGVLGAGAIGLGATLAAAFTSIIDESVTPLAVGYVLYGGLAALSAVAAEPRRARSAAPVAP